ncbi:MAG: hypothetical protein VXX37_05445, partial [Pseudomonadota bacterium]|nr:hypothetical protein [Pseudomonadota bacterium]
CPGRGIVCDCGGGKYNSQVKRAFVAGASLAVVLEAAGDNAPLSVKIRHLRGSDDAFTGELSTIPAEVARLLEA